MQDLQRSESDKAQSLTGRMFILIHDCKKFSLTLRRPFWSAWKAVQQAHDFGIGVAQDCVLNDVLVL